MSAAFVRSGENQEKKKAELMQQRIFPKLNRTIAILSKEHAREREIVREFTILLSKSTVFFGIWKVLCYACVSLFPGTFLNEGKAAKIVREGRTSERVE